MISTTVRITAIEIEGLKNVNHGKLTFEEGPGPGHVSVLGLFGQNGSGKTALISVISILKSVLSGHPLRREHADLIQFDAKHARIAVTFKLGFVENEQLYADIYYEFKLRRAEVHSEQPSVDGLNAAELPVIFDEKLATRLQDGVSKGGKKRWIETNVEKPFAPATSYRTLVGAGNDQERKLLVSRLLEGERAKSFVHSAELKKAIASKVGTEFKLAALQEDDFKKARESDEIYARLLLFILRRLRFFGVQELFVVDASLSGQLSLNTLQLSVKLKGDGPEPHIAGQINLSLMGPQLIPPEVFPFVETSIRQVDTVLGKIVPGLSIRLDSLGTVLDEQGKKLVSAEIVSTKNGKPVPLRYESDGVKKIISVMHLLISVFNNESVTVAIDELDSGIFEYLLGELLKIISEKGKGQLIFTSHNLHMLEAIDKKFVAFTTTDADNRYIRLTGVKSTNNLRDFYYRSILLGPDAEFLYLPTKNAQISLALRSAGKAHE